MESITLIALQHNRNYNINYVTMTETYNIMEIVTNYVVT